MNPRVESDHFLHQAIVEGKSNVIAKYLGDGGSASIVDSYGCEPLYTAVKYDRLDIATMLLAAGGDIIRWSPFRGNAFGAACWNGNLRMMDFCIQAGVDVNEIHDGETMLDSLESQRNWCAARDLNAWQLACNHLVKCGAVHSQLLSQDNSSLAGQSDAGKGHPLNV